jgi:sulfide:quinone oxidoreductase
LAAPSYRLLPVKKHVVILGAGFGGLELATRLSDSLVDDVHVTLLDRNDSFSFGFSKLDVLFGRKTVSEVLLPYSDISKEGVEFRQEHVNSIDPEKRRVTTDQGSYDADILAVALGADYDFAATPGFEAGGREYYSVAGAERMREALPSFDSGTILIGILGHPFKCPPAPFEGALLLHDHLVERGVRADAEIRVIGPMAAPVPITKEVSQSILDALHERGIEYVPQQRVVELDTKSKEARLESGGTVPYDLFVGIPVHRVPEVVESSGLAVDGWVPVDHGNLQTRFPDVYALGDLVAIPMAKAGVFAEAAAAVVADDIGARLRGGVLERPYEGAGSCYLEFGGGMVGKVEANFLGGPAPTARLVGPSRDLAAEKEAFASTRRARWFGS